MRLIAVSLIVLLVASAIPLGLGETPWLEDYSYRKLITIAGSAGAGTGYVVFVKAYYADGTDSFEVLTGGHNGVNATKVYLDGKVEADFDDVRFTETDGETELDYFRDTYTASTSALFAVEVSENLNTTQSFYIYFGDAGQATESNALATFRRVISSGVALSLPLNEGAGETVIDYSGNGINGTVNGADWVSTGKFGTALEFDGATDNIDCTNNVLLEVDAADYSLLVWVEPDVINDLMTIAGKIQYGTNQWGLYQLSGFNRFYQVMRAAGAEASAYSNVDVVPDTQYCLVGQREADRVYLFVNGAEQVVDNAFADNSNTAAVKFYVGKNYVDNAQNFDGVISGVFLFNYALTDAEISDLYSYYPQCSIANTGKLYLRSFVNPEPQPSSIDSLEVNNRYASTNYVWMAVLLVIGFVFMGLMLLRRGN